MREKSKNITIIIVVISVLYLLGSFVLPYTGVSYRMWVQAVGGILVTMVLPLVGLLWAGYWLWRKLSIRRALKLVLSIAAGAGYIWCILVAVLLLAFSMDTEKKLSDNLLIVNEGFPDPYYKYYRPFAFFFRIPADLTDEVKLEYLEKKYDRIFGIGEEGKFYEEEFPEIVVDVYVSGMEFVDNYVESVACNYLLEGCESLGITREYYVAKDYFDRNGWLYLELEGEADAAAFAADASALLQYVMERTDFFEDYRGGLGFYSGKGESEITGFLPFGKLGHYDEMSEDYYKDAELIEEIIVERYQDALDFQRELEESRAEWQASLEASREEGANGSVTGTDVQGNTNATDASVQSVEQAREEAAKAVYDAVLAADGYSCEICYNAKGNLYLDLGSRPAGEPEDKSSTGNYQFKLVYDRTSKNDACELFVLYKEHYSEEGINDGTVILDMYAVDKESGDVIVADRQAWDDAGSEAYRNATGE